MKLVAFLPTGDWASLEGDAAVTFNELTDDQFDELVESVRDEPDDAKCIGTYTQGEGFQPFNGDNKPVCPLTVGEVGMLYDDYVGLLNFSAQDIPLWDALNPDQKAEVVAIAATLLFSDGDFTDLFNGRLGTFLEEEPGG